VTAVLGRVRLVPPAPGTEPEAAPLEEPEPSRPPPGEAGRRPPGRLRRVWILPAAVVVAGALALVPVVRDDGPGPGEAQVEVDGTATVARAGGGTEVVEDASVRIGPGDVIEVTEGTARFARSDDVTFEGRAGPAVAGRAGTTVEMGAVPELLAGPLLVVAPVPVELRAAGSQVTVGPAAGDDGAGRLDRRLGLGVGAYRGTVAVDSAGLGARVPALRRIEVAAPGSLGRRDLPIEYTASDPWDRRFLAGALLVDRQLAPLLAAFDATAGPGPATVAGLRRARPDLPAAALPALVRAAPSSSAALVTAVLADLGPGGTFPSRAAAVQRFRDDGAPWGLVALDREVAPPALLAGVRQALDRLGPDVAAAAAETGGGAGAPPPATEPTAPGPDAADPAGTGAPAPAPDPAGPGGGATPPGGGATPPGGSSGGVPVPPPPAPLPPLPDPGGVGGTVGGVVEGAGETVGGVVEGAGGTVGGVVEGAGSTLGGVVDGLLGVAGRALGGPAPAPSTAPSTEGLLGLGIGGL